MILKNILLSRLYKNKHYFDFETEVFKDCSISFDTKINKYTSEVNTFYKYFLFCFLKKSVYKKITIWMVIVNSTNFMVVRVYLKIDDKNNMHRRIIGTWFSFFATNLILDINFLNFIKFEFSFLWSNPVSTSMSIFWKIVRKYKYIFFQQKCPWKCP